MRKTIMYHGFLKIFNVRGVNQNGVTVDREVMSRATEGKSDDCVVGLLFDTEKNLFYLTKQYRAGAKEEDKYLVEAVAGTIEGDEDPKECFMREAFEEVGFECNPDETSEVGCLYTSPGGTTERMYLFLSNGVRTSEGGGLESENEDIEVLELTLEELEAFEIKDLKTAYLINFTK
jgi:GDP-mannose pyrophosphatase NudK